MIILDYATSNINYSDINHLRLNSNALVGAKMAMHNISKAVISPKTPAAPRPPVKLLPTIMNPLASAKSAIHHIANHTKITKDRI
jgi:hypothetical protein